MNVYFVSVLLLRQTTRQQFIRFCVGGHYAEHAFCFVAQEMRIA